jgi:pseudouridine kinase
MQCCICLSLLLHRSGEVAAAVADVASVEQHLNTATLARFRPHIQSAGLLVVETNLEAGALEMICSTAAAAGVPVLLEPVSVPKSIRCGSSTRVVSAVVVDLGAGLVGVTGERTALALLTVSS